MATSRRPRYQDPCSNPGVSGSALTGFLQILLGCASVALGVLLILEDNDVLPIFFPIWGGGLVSNIVYDKWYHYL